MALWHMPARAEPVLVQTEKVAVVVETLAEGLDHPWAVEPLPDGSLLVTERAGRLSIYRSGKLTPVRGLPPLWTKVQGGLLDVALSRDFQTDGILFFTATQNYEGGIGTVVIRARLSGNGQWLSHAKPIFRSSRPEPVDHNFGSRIAVAPDGSLFVTVGDQARPERAQDRFDHRGSVVHINADGSIPDDNPFRDGVDGLPEIWSYGHRNPQGITLDPSSGTLYTVEHGAKGGDEINHPEPGRNYGWPVIAYGTDYDDTRIGIGTSTPGMEQPVHYWDPSIAPSAILFYRGDMFPEWQGDVLVSALKDQLISRLARDSAGRITSEERFLTEQFGRIRDLKEAPDGALLAVTDDDNGLLIRISRAAGPVPATHAEP
ncbi:MAG: PQQ-dependent sugar dehydrogenase [Rhizobium sp.]|nr:PQQ-dependent sugar dehydrogenase [Rhizobium sp.]